MCPAAPLVSSDDDPAEGSLGGLCDALVGMLRVEGKLASELVWGPRRGKAREAREARLAGGGGGVSGRLRGEVNRAQSAAEELHDELTRVKAVVIGWHTVIQ